MALPFHRSNGRSVCLRCLGTNPCPRCATATSLAQARSSEIRPGGIAHGPLPEPALGPVRDAETATARPASVGAMLRGRGSPAAPDEPARRQASIGEGRRSRGRLKAPLAYEGSPTSRARRDSEQPLHRALSSVRGGIGGMALPRISACLYGNGNGSALLGGRLPGQNWRDLALFMVNELKIKVF